MDADHECSRNCSDFNRTEEVTCFEEGVCQSLLDSIDSSLDWPLFLLTVTIIPCFRLDSTTETTLTTSQPGTPRIVRCKLTKDQPNIDCCLYFRLVARLMSAASPSPFTRAMPSVIWKELSSTESKMLRWLILYLQCDQVDIRWLLDQSSAGEAPR